MADGWTLDTLCKHLSDRINAVEKLLTARLEAAERSASVSQVGAERALEKASAAADKRFESVNEFRAMLSDQTAHLLTRSVYDVQHQALVERIDVNSARLTRMESIVASRKEGLGMIGVLVLGGFSVLASLVSIITLVVHIYRP